VTPFWGITSFVPIETPTPPLLLFIPPAELPQAPKASTLQDEFPSHRSAMAIPTTSLAS